jgi:Mrp family chromosome partitioning ATPase
MITITISGPCGTGKSILASAIATLMEEMGVQVTLGNDDFLGDSVEKYMGFVAENPSEAVIFTTNDVPSPM